LKKREQNNSPDKYLQDRQRKLRKEEEEEEE
jgi:hypothetical protein